MQFSLYRDKLKDAVGKMRSSLSTGSVNPVLEHFLFEIQKGILKVKATNLNITTIWETKVDTEDNFSFTLPGNTLSSLIGSLEQEKVTFSFNTSTGDVTLTCGKYTWEAISGDVKGYPVINIPDNLNEIQLPQNFPEMLRKVSFSISNDVSKPDLNSLCIDINKDSSGNLCLISTDRVRLSYANATTEFKKDYLRIVIPRTSVLEILKLEPKSMYYTDDLKSIFFISEDLSGKFTFRTSTTNAKYPDIYAYINNTFNEKEIRVRKIELMKAIKRIKVTSDKVDKVGTLEFSKNKVTISARGSSSKSKEEINVDLGEVENPPSFNIKLDLMLEYLSEDSDDDILFKIVNNMCLVFDKNNYRHVLSIER
jgi:DNA polymerase-3 subunit beta